MWVVVLTNLPGQWLQCHANGSNVCRVLRQSLSRWGVMWVVVLRQIPFVRVESVRGFFFFFFTLITGPRRSLSLKLSDKRVFAGGG